MVADFVAAWDDDQQASPVASRRLPSHDTGYGAGRSPLGTRPVGGRTSPACSPQLAAMSYRLRSRRLPVGSAPVRFQSGNSCDSAVKAGHRRLPLARQKRPICRDIPRCTESRVLLASRRSRVRIPSAASRKACICRSFCNRSVVRFHNKVRRCGRRILGTWSGQRPRRSMTLAGMCACGSCSISPLGSRGLRSG